MLKVECESCRAPYQIDERRVPATGLKMRCPKCGHSFVVNNPAAAGAKPPAPAAPPGPVPSPAAPPKKVAQRTMVGIAPPAPPPARAAVRAAPLPAAPAPPPARPMLPSDFPAALGSLDEADLPTVSAGLPAVSAGLPAPARKPAPPSTAQPAKPAPPAPSPQKHVETLGFGEIDLPAVPADLPAPRAAGRGGARSPHADLDIDLPITSPGLPSPKAGPAAPALATAEARRQASPPAPASASRERPDFADFGDLPASASDLPMVSAGLPAFSAGLPAISAGLPSVAASFPSAAAAGLPVHVGAGLPSHVAAGLPATRGFGEIDLPASLDSFPSSPEPGRHLPVPAAKSAGPAGRDPFGDFGELDLPREGNPVPPPPFAGGAVPQGMGKGPMFDSVAPADNGASSAFGELDFASTPGWKPPASGNPATAPNLAHSNPPPASGGTGGGVGFGERDLGGSHFDLPPIATEAPIPTAPSAPPPGNGRSGTAVPLGEMAVGLGGAGGFEAPLGAAAARPMRERPPVAPRKSKRGGRIALIVAAVAALGGTLLEFTPYGAFGRKRVSDMLHAKDYAAATTAAMTSAEKRLSTGSYAEAKGALEDVGAAHATAPRDYSLTAYAVVVDGYVGARYGLDPGRASRAKQWLAELPANSDPLTQHYAAVARGAQAAASGELASGRATLDAAAKVMPSDPIQLDVALIRGELELDAHDAAAALAAFQSALLLAPQDSRPHYGVARADQRLGDLATATKEVNVTLGVAPDHAGALLMRATLTRGTDNDAPSQKDLGAILEGAGRLKAAPAELADAFALRGAIAMDHGLTSDARSAFDEALKLDPRSLIALLGQGELLFKDARFTEALTRFDTALQVDPTSIAAIVADVKTKVALEHLEDAKTQLTDANTKYPKTADILMWLGKVEGLLTNAKAAEKDLHDAIAVIDAKSKDSVLPFVWLSSLLASQGRAEEAQAVLTDAKKKLPDSAALQRAFGEVAEAQNRFDDAVAYFKVALTRDPTDVTTRFRLGVTYIIERMTMLPSRATGRS